MLAGDVVAFADVGHHRVGLEVVLGPVHQLVGGQRVDGHPLQPGLDDDHRHLLDVVELGGSEVGAQGVAAHLRVALGGHLDALSVLEVVDAEAAAVDDDGVAGAEAFRDVLGELELGLHQEHGLGVAVLRVEEVLPDDPAVVLGDDGEHLPGVEPEVLRLLDPETESLGLLPCDRAVFPFVGGGKEVGHAELVHVVLAPLVPVLLQRGEEEALRHGVGDGALAGEDGVLLRELGCHHCGRVALHPAGRARRSQGCVCCGHGLRLLTFPTCPSARPYAPGGRPSCSGSRTPRRGP